jgi:hypothetical protein
MALLIFNHNKGMDSDYYGPFLPGKWNRADKIFWFDDIVLTCETCVV